jgi:hypothetical protein
MPLNAIDMLLVSEKYSSTLHGEAGDKAAETASAEAIVSEEIDLGMDRSLETVGYNDELCVYERTASDSPSFDAVNAHMRSMQEMLIRLKNPTNLLIIGIPYVPLRLGIGNITLANSIHLDYMERHMDTTGMSYDVIAMQAIRDNEFPKTFDMASVHLPQINHNHDMVQNIFDQLPIGGAIILTSSNDHGRLFEYDGAHDYSEMFTDFASLANSKMYHMSAGLGVSLLTKTK